MQIPVMSAFFDELEKIAIVTENVPMMSGRASGILGKAGRVARHMNPPIESTAKQWMASQMRPGGALTSPAQSAARLAQRAPVQALSAGQRAAQAVRGVAMH